MSDQVRTRSEQSTATTKTGDTVVGLVVFGCIMAGFTGILRAMSASGGFDVLCCLLGSVSAFGAAYYMCTQRG